MGEVYRARDGRLGRDVALKVLPDLFAADAERLARFEREAQLLASLNHPNIAIIHGVEDAGGRRALVMELVEGPTLSEIISQASGSGLQAIEVLPIARQIADALETAHERGVIHRDLKPANIKVRPDGTVKILDFGLAKAFEPTPADPLQAGLSHSPTITTPAATRAGTLLGTAAYMSPEQAKGRPVDKRTDVWAYGCVLYEMLSGRRAFPGDDVSDTLAEILKGEPDWGALPADTPPAIRRLLMRCLAKDRKQRVPDIAIARFDIDEVLGAPTGTGSAPINAAASRPAKRSVLLAAAGALVAGVVLTLVVSNLTRDASSPRPLRRFAIALDPLQRVTSTASQPVALSRDGRRLVYIAQEATASRLYFRSLDQIDPIMLQSAGETVGSVFLSPDGEWAAYVDAASSALKKVRLGTDTSVALAQGIVVAGGMRGGTWGSTGDIVFSTTARPELMRVSETGGTPEPLTSPGDGAFHMHPHFLPGDRALLYVVGRPNAPSRIAVRRLDDGEERELVDGTWPRYAGSGHVLFMRENVVWAMRFDPDSLEVRGEPIPVIEGVNRPVDAAEDGSLVYLEADPGFQGRQALIWVDRQGRETPAAPAQVYGWPRVSPDGTRVVLDMEESGNTDVFVLDLARGTPLRLTYDAGRDRFPTWSPDGQSITFQSGRAGSELFRKASDGTGPEERVATLPSLGGAEAFTPDGAMLLYTVVDPKTGRDIWILPLAGDPTPRPLITTPGVDGPLDLSPDGQWLVYESNESGRDEIYVQPFPDVASGRWQITQGGGGKPAWSRNGRELFFHQGTALKAVSVDPVDRTFRWGPATTVLDGPYFYGNLDGPRTYDVAPDGRFLLLKPTGDSAQVSFVLIQNWDEELERLLP